MPNDWDAKSSSPNEFPVVVVRDDGNTHKTPEYVSAFYIDAENIDKNDKNI